MTDFAMKDSGEHAQYDSGMRRDTEAGKPRFDLIRTKLQPYEEQMITRYAMRLALGAAKYDPRNWEDGDSEEELDRAKSSLLRHTEQLVAGETDEDHAAAVWFNTQAIEYFRWRIAQKAKSSTSTVDFKFEGDSQGSQLLAMITGMPGEEVRSMIRGNLVSAAKEEDKALDEKFAFGSAEFSDSEDTFAETKARHQRLLNEWHNRPTTEDVVLGFDGSRSEEGLVMGKRTWTLFPPVAQEMIAKAFDEASKEWTTVGNTPEPTLDQGNHGE